MPRMLGRYRTPGCWSGTRSDHRTHPDGGPDCSGHYRDTRWRKRVESRSWLAAEGYPPEALVVADELDCRHGCDGAEVVHGHPSDVCNWQCHLGLVIDPERAARWDALAS